MSGRYLRLFRGDPKKTRTFPSPVDTSNDASVAWMLTYSPEAMTRADRLYAASVISAYSYLICEMTARDRQSVVTEIRRQLKVNTQ